MKSACLFTLALCAAGLTVSNAADPASSGSATPATPAKSGSVSAVAPAKTGSSSFVLPDPVAVVEGKPIAAADVQVALSNALQRSGRDIATIPDSEKLAAARSIVRNMIGQIFVTTRSADIKVSDADVDARYQQFLAQVTDRKRLDEQLKANNMTLDKLKEKVRESMQVQQWVQQQAKGKVTVTEADAKTYYDANPSFFDQPELVRASHILIAVPADAKPEVVEAKKKAIDEVAARLAKGEDFAKVAKEVSEDTGSKEKGGDVNFFPKARMVPEFADAAFALKKDEVSKPVKTKFGFHIIKATDRKEAHKIAFDDVKARIIERLTGQKQQEVARSVVDDLLAKADVKNNLPPEVKPPTPAPAPDSKEKKSEDKK